MGIKGLWPKLATAKDTRLLNEFCLTQGFQKNYREQRSVILGVHASDLLENLKASTHRYPCAHAGSPTETFFSILCKFSEAAAVFMFVFDGPASPKHKQNEEGIYQDARRLILHFGYYLLEAEGEAGPFLASLSHSHVIDGVISEDSDLLALGVDLVLRISRDQSLHDLVYNIHTLNAIKQIMRLEQEGIILVAILSGNSLHAGLEGCGVATSIQLGRSDLGRLLVAKFRNLSQHPPALRAFLRSWRSKLHKELKDNARGFLTNRRLQAAKSVDDGFPNLDALNRYVNATPSLPQAYVEDLSAILKPRQPDITRIVSFCQEQWHWSNSQVIEQFSKSFWKGMMLRMLQSPLVLYDQNQHIFRERHWRMDLIRESPDRKFQNAIEYVQVTVSVTGILAVAALSTPRPVEQVAWVPLPVLLVSKLPRSLGQLHFDLAVSGVANVELEAADQDVNA
ncbi:hypothetical protein PQX77_002240 [Marasmius sp. AFHP31]|nr:hypothetical protein PQX77_002240 [Marasmius sp. AFHP31]